jgi:hypothetical protein
MGLGFVLLLALLAYSLLAIKPAPPEQQRNPTTPDSTA